MFRVAVIGAGNWGARVAARVRDMDGMRVVAVCDQHEGTARDVAARVGADPATDWHYALDKADGVIVATPPTPARAELVAAVIDAGMQRVRVEKPLASSYADAVSLVGHAAQASCRLTVGHTSVFQPMLPAFADAITPPLTVAAMQFERLCERAPVHAASTSPVWDLMVHDFAIHQVVAPDAWDGGPPTVHGAAVMPNGAIVATVGTATFLASWAHPSTTRRVRAFVGAADGTTAQVTYDEQCQSILAVGKSYTATDAPDALGLELAAWRDGGGFAAIKAAQIVHVAEQVELLLNARAGV